MSKNETWIFPHPNTANDDGLLAVGDNLSVEFLLNAYRWGIFPWFNAGDPILWWSLHPRLVLFPDELKVSKSMNSYFNQKKYTVTYNQDFEKVITSCKTQNRKGQNVSWIHKNIITAYKKLHHLQYAHSVEVWEGEELVGGLYGVQIAKVFFGESMFSKKSNASKFGFISLIRKLQLEGVQLIDCQQDTMHLRSLGARTIDRDQFLSYLRTNILEEMKENSE